MGSTTYCLKIDSDDEFEFLWCFEFSKNEWRSRTAKEKGKFLIITEDEYELLHLVVCAKAEMPEAENYPNVIKTAYKLLLNKYDLLPIYDGRNIE